ncbi:hypothetical protein [Salinispora vitiensis]|uniref:hypothetical protein n=1 Tax=Salinispora vitiensis TaxID=999544 RepID=UPI0013A532C8|nr:hypothetical protein [Salinispora vitiensis]
MTPKTVTTAAEFTSLLSLENVRVYEVTARRRDGFDMQEIPVDGDSSDLHVQQALSNGEFIFRAQIELRGSKAVIKVDVAAVFGLTTPVNRPTDQVLDDFAHQAGLPTIMPYLRVHVQQAARLIGVPAPLLKHYWGNELRQLEIRQHQHEEGKEAGRPEPSA